MLDRLSRKDAVALGLKRYVTGECCPQGHIAERMVSTRACCACLSEKKVAWMILNPEKVNAQRRNWVQENSEQAKASKAASQARNRESANKRQRRWLSENREQSNAASAAWAAANPGKCNAKAAKCRAAQLQRTPSWADQDAIAGMYELAQLFRRIGLDIDVDHIVPLQGQKVSGLHVADNLQLIHSIANKSKSNDFAIL